MADLLPAVRARLGTDRDPDATFRVDVRDNGLALDCFVSWRRRYGCCGALSDERRVVAEVATIDGCLAEILAWEDAADLAEGGHCAAERGGAA